MNQSNPYHNLPVEPEMFFGRQGDVEQLVQALTGSPGHSIALIGGRRMGKTSMLEAIIRQTRLLTGTANSNVLLLPIFLDLGGEGIDSVEGFYHTIYQQTLMELEGLVSSLPATIFAANQTPAPIFRRILETWSKAVRTQYGSQLRIILLLDECEEIVDKPWTTALHNTLRSLLVGNSTRNNLKMVMAGSHRFLTQVRQRGSPLWNIFNYHTLQVFNLQATTDLITIPTGDVLSQEVVHTITTMSGGHPFLVQHLMYHLCNEGLKHATPKTIHTIAARFSQERNDFEDWCNGIGEIGIGAYRILIKESRPLTEDDICRVLQDMPINIRQALNALCYHGVAIYEEENKRYHIAGEMFRNWFMGTMQIPEEVKQPFRSNKMSLDGQQRADFQQALLSAFTTEPALQEMIMYQFTLNLKTIAGGNNLGEIAFNLIDWFEKEGRTHELVEKAREAVPGNPTLREFAEKYFSV